MITQNEKVIKLPSLEYMQCEYATERIEYIFPNQKFGKANTILKSESYLDDNQVTSEINILKSIVWEEENSVQEYSYNYKN